MDNRNIKVDLINLKNMKDIKKDFISEENREFKFKLGHLLASSLSGFICGVVVASIIWMVAFKYLQHLFGF